MTGAPLVAVLVVALSTGAACRPAPRQEARRMDSTEVAKRNTRLAVALATADSGAAREAAIARWVLPQDLAEISGLALTADARLFAHGDEQGRISEIDYRRGVVVKRFMIGKQPVRADFEAITVVNDALFLLASNGKLYEFREGANGERVPYTVHDTRLGRECEFEGVAFDPAINSLLLACKNVGRKSLRGFLVIYRWKLRGGNGPRLSRLTVPLARVIGSNGWKGLHPSDITVDPSSGHYVVVASQEKALIEITPAGALIFSRPLPKDLEQAEGVAITGDSILIVGDEAERRSATITLYRWP
jgi:uncharacterized protein YjiK